MSYNPQNGRRDNAGIRAAVLTLLVGMAFCCLAFGIMYISAFFR